jgi:hypothetical protein
MFTTEAHTKLFALSHIILSSNKSITTAVQSVVDSSRYFVTQISGASGGGKQNSATIGFGFRDRDVAIDLLGTLQGFQRSIERERLAKEQFFQNNNNVVVAAAASLLLPEFKLAADEKIHISIGGGSSKVKTKANKSSSSGDGGGGAAKPVMMLKKPPKFVTPEERNANTNTNTNTNTNIDRAMGAMNLQQDDGNNNKNKNAFTDSDSEVAVGGEKVGESLDNNGDEDGFDDDDFGDFQGAS